MSEEHHHDEAMHKAMTRYHEVTGPEYQRTRDASFCVQCGLIGFYLVQRALMEHFLEDAATEDEDRPVVAKNLAVLVGTPMPKHVNRHRPRRADA